MFMIATILDANSQPMFDVCSNGGGGYICRTYDDPDSRDVYQMPERMRGCPSALIKNPTAVRVLAFASDDYPALEEDWAPLVIPPHDDVAIVFSCVPSMPALADHEYFIRITTAGMKPKEYRIESGNRYTVAVGTGSDARRWILHTIVN